MCKWLKPEQAQLFSLTLSGDCVGISRALKVAKFKHNVLRALASLLLFLPNSPGDELAVASRLAIMSYGSFSTWLYWRIEAPSITDWFVRSHMPLLLSWRSYQLGHCVYQQHTYLNFVDSTLSFSSESLLGCFLAFTLEDVKAVATSVLQSSK